MEGYVLGTGSRLDGRGSNGERAMEICEPRPQAFGVSGGSQPWLSCSASAWWPTGIFLLCPPFWGFQDFGNWSVLAHTTAVCSEIIWNGRDRCVQSLGKMQQRVMTKSSDCEARLPEFTLCPHPLQLPWSWGSYLTSLFSSFHICKMRMITVITSRVLRRIQWVIICKVRKSPAHRKHYIKAC